MRRTGRPLGSRKVNESRLGKRIRGVTRTAAYKVQAAEVKRLQKLLDEELEREWRSYLCFGCMSLFPRREVERKGWHNLNDIKTSWNWGHLYGVERFYKDWNIQIFTPRLGNQHVELYSVYYCSLCRREGKKEIKERKLFENELIKGLRPYMDRPKEMRLLTPALRSTLSMIHVYVCECGGVQRDGWFEHTRKIGEMFRFH